ncbi:type VI secretion system baseplate subunit TssF [Limnobacter humi]|uniref:Type VI secretion system baseplate subunit TssF n=1 Tax=Limnobacter humi TaxID=1778671 RepID=A0ABT1WFT3_9BURK|nr:type VI secretion system baseplate subunit TssF [Limnobacter humi]MCQ8895763.1 type VI secretion system baseplate subunit TssF [Limnobacter humi]
MDPRLLVLYNQELTHVRDVANEFAQRHPKIAAGLGLGSHSAQDPTVERLLEGFAFLTARTQLKLQASFPEFTGQLLERLMPGVLAPTPSMGVVKLSLDGQDPALGKGLTVPTGAVFQAPVLPGAVAPVTFRSAQACTLWPLQMETVRHGPPHGDGLQHLRLSSALQLCLKRTGAGSVSDLPMDCLDFYVSAPQEWAFELHQRIAHRSTVVAVRGSSDEPWHILPPGALSTPGFEDHQAVLPEHNQVFSGFRLLHELFSLPERFLFFRIQHLLRHCQQAKGPGLEMLIGFPDTHPQMDRWVDLDSVALYCIPVVNLFPMACDRIQVDPSLHELHLIPNRSRPTDFEVYAVQSVIGHGTQHREALLPLYSSSAASLEMNQAAVFYALRRQTSLLPENQKRTGGRSSHVGTEVFIGLSSAHGRLLSERAIQQLSVQALCTNRDLPLLLPLGRGNTDLQASASFPVQSIRFVRGPSRPCPPLAEGRASWQLIELLALHTHGLHSLESAPDPLNPFQRLLSLFSRSDTPAHEQWAKAIQTARLRPMTQRLIQHGRPALYRGLELCLTLDEDCLQGLSAGLLGQALAVYVRRSLCVNTALAVRLVCEPSGQVMLLNPDLGLRPLV